MPAITDEQLRRDTKKLTQLLEEVISSIAGPEALQLVAQIRDLAHQRRAGDAGAEARLVERIASLSEAEAGLVSRSFGVFFDLSNLAEDRHRVRVLRHRERESRGRPLSESIADAIARLKKSGLSPEEVQQALNRLSIELVFTAHPSEAKRRSIRAKLRRMRLALQDLDRDDLLPRELQRLERSIKTELTTLWQTDFLRPSRPTVLQEVERGLSITPRLAEVIPQVYDAMRRALATEYPNHPFKIPVFLRFGSWMGGDRDGNPFVTSHVTAQTLQWLREAAIRMHLAECQQLSDFLSQSSRVEAVDDILTERLQQAVERWPDLTRTLEPIPPREVYRRWLAMIHWRLTQALTVRVFVPPPAGAYRDGEQLAADLDPLLASLRGHHGELIEQVALRWYDLIQVFGLHLTRLDIRQESGRYREIMTEIFRAIRLHDDFASLDETARQDLLSRSMPWQQPIPEVDLAPLTKDTLQLFRLIRGAMQAFGPQVFGGHVISLTEQPSDVLTVLWLWKWSSQEVGRIARHPEAGDDGQLRIMPLFEKIGDLSRAAVTFDGILSHPVYRAHLAEQNDRQMIMVGYSDSTKDGGYLAACWGLYRAQSDLQKVAEKYRVKITFFHGRGGSLGRGGGPAARGILSLPAQALDGSLRLTEQGEVLAERYDDVQIAYRHLEQVTWATLIASTLPKAAIGTASNSLDAGEAISDQRWSVLMQSLAERSYAAYRELVDQPGFIRFFGLATPVDEIENLPIASRPARRRGERTLADLRAIPWVFSWTQNRCLIPAWYGLGTALGEIRDQQPEQWEMVREMYRQWPFFQATIDNAALALAKTDLAIAQRYAELMDDAEIEKRIWDRIAGEREKSRRVVCEILGHNELLAGTPRLQQSIDLRNPSVDPLNLIQVELLKRRRASVAAGQAHDDDELRELLRLTVQGIAAGLRTTG